MKHSRRKITLPILAAILLLFFGSWVAEKLKSDSPPPCVTRFGYPCAYSKADWDKSRRSGFAAFVKLQDNGVIPYLPEGKGASILERDGDSCKISLAGGNEVWTMCEALDCHK